MNLAGGRAICSASACNTFLSIALRPAARLQRAQRLIQPSRAVLLSGNTRGGRHVVDALAPIRQRYVIRAGNPRQYMLEMVESGLKLVMVHAFPRSHRPRGPTVSSCVRRGSVELICPSGGHYTLAIRMTHRIGERLQPSDAQYDIQEKSPASPPLRIRGNLITFTRL